MNYNSARNQEIKRQFVERNVIYSVSQLVAELAQNDNYFDTVYPLLSKPDYEAAVENSNEIHVQYSNRLDGFVWVDKNTHTVSEPFQQYYAALEDAVVENNLEYDHTEAYEHWIVADWLANKLRQKGEIVGELFGLTIWGRQSSGQAIFLDGVISQICEDQEILEGQKCEWS